MQPTSVRVLFARVRELEDAVADLRKKERASVDRELRTARVMQEKIRCEQELREQMERELLAATQDHEGVVVVASGRQVDLVNNGSNLRVNYDSLEEENAGLYTERNRLRRENAALKDERKEMKAMFDDLAAELDGLSARFDKAVAAMGGQRPLTVTGDRAAQGAVSERLAPVQAIGGQGNRMNAVVVGGWK